MLSFDFNHYRVENNPERNWVGRYKFEGDTIQILWINQFTDPTRPDIILRNETSAHPPVSPSPRIFIPMCRCTGKQLSGLYHWNAGTADQYIQFFPNGTFIDHGVTDQLIVPSRFYDHPRIQNGTYQIARQTIIFAFADGHRATRTFLAPKVQQGKPTFDWISLGRHMFFEENYRIKLSQGACLYLLVTVLLGSPVYPQAPNYTSKPANSTPQKPESFIDRVLDFLSISYTPGALKGPAGDPSSGQIWIASLKNNSAHSLTSSGNYPSPIFSGRKRGYTRASW
jgi:hypothetical protein